MRAAVRCPVLSVLAGVLVVAACGGRTFSHRSVSGAIERDPIYGGDHVYVPFERWHEKHYDVDPGLFGNDMEGPKTDTDTTRVDQLGVIDVDLRSGLCRWMPGSGGRSVPSHWLALERRPGDSVGDTKAGKIYRLPGSSATVRLSDWSRYHGVMGSVYDPEDGERWPFHSGIAATADRLYLPENDQGVQELSRPPLETLALHRPPRLRPDRSRYVWAQRRPWRDGETYRDFTLRRGPTRTVLSRRTHELDVGDHEVPVFVFEGTDLAATPSSLIRLDPHHRPVAIDVAGLPRVAPYDSAGTYLVDVDGTIGVSSSHGSRLGDVHVELTVLGFDGRAIALAGAGRMIYVFDVTTRGWRELSYATCVPRVVPSG